MRPGQVSVIYINELIFQLGETMKSVLFKRTALVVALAAAAAAHAEGNMGNGISFYALLDGGIASTTVSRSATPANNNTTSEFLVGGEAPDLFGIKGERKFEGLTAGFQLEQGFNLNPMQNNAGTFDSAFGSGGGGGLYNREASLSLSGDFGSVKIGTQPDAAFGAVLASDARATDLGSVIPMYLAMGTTGTYQQGMFSYTTPKANGITATGQFKFANQQTSCTPTATNGCGVNSSPAAGSGVRANVMYANGPWSISAGYYSDNNNNATSATNGRLEDVGESIGGGYTAGPLTVKALLLEQKNVNGGLLTGRVNTTGLSGVYTLNGKWSLNGGYYQQKDPESTNMMNVITTAVGLHYSVMHDITLYGQYVNIQNHSSNSANAALGDLYFVGAGTAAAGGGFVTYGEQVNVLNIGVTYAFF